MLQVSSFRSRFSRRLILVWLLISTLIGRTVAQDTALLVPGSVPAPVVAPVAAAETFRQPMFPGGQVELTKFLSRNLQYPAEAADARISGRVVVSFWVDEQGHAYGFGAIQSPHPALEAEALRVARKIDRWEPGLQEGRLATMQMYLPVVFKLMSQ